MTAYPKQESLLQEVSVQEGSLREYASGSDPGHTVAKLGEFHARLGGQPLAGKYCQMPLFDRNTDVFMWADPLIHAEARYTDSKEFLAQTVYLKDGISKTVTYTDDVIGRWNPRLVYPIDVYKRRIEKTREKMKEHGFDALIVTDLHDIVYLCGHHTEGGSFIALVITHDAPPFMVGRYLELGDARLLNGSNAYEKTYISEWWCCEDHTDPIETLRLAMEEHQLEGKRTGFEYRGLSKGDEVDQYKKIKGVHDQDGKLEAMPDPPLKKFPMIDCPRFIEFFRLIKADFQLKKIRMAGVFSEIGIKAGIEAVRPGVADREIIASIVYAMMVNGSRLPAYGPFVSIGPASARGHATGDGHYVKEGDLVCIEVGGSYERMHCSSMQMCYVGHELPDWLVEAEAILTEIFETVLPAMKPGVPACDIHDHVNRIYSKSKFWYTRYARSSYNIGGKAFPQDWSDGGFSCVKGNEEPLQAGLVQHFIPWASTPFGAYFKSVTVVVTEQGAEPLMNYSTKVHLIKP